jgi:NADH dehydrogenase
VILVTGGTGTLGRLLVRRLLEAGKPVRLLVREGTAPPAGVEGAVADLTDDASIARAVAGTEAVVSAMTAFGGARGTTPALVDGEGNRKLIRAAAAAGVRRFVLLSIRGASPQHPIDVHRMKHLAEQELLASDLNWTIFRPTVYMETWGELLGASVLAGRPVRVFGAGDNPINFISADDVARLIVGALDDEGLARQAVDLAGPENVSMMEVVRSFERLSGRRARVQHVPVAALRLASALLPRVSATGARFARAGLGMATGEMAVDAAATRNRFPGLQLTTFEEFARRRVAAAAAEPAPLAGG